MSWNACHISSCGTWTHRVDPATDDPACAEHGGVDRKPEPTPEQKREAGKWKFEHYQAFTQAVWECDDIQTLRALAHRIGYKEGT